MKKINNSEKEKVIKKLDDGRYQMEFWHNKIVLEKVIYSTENINNHKLLEQKIYENGKLYLETYFNYEKKEEVSIGYNENGKRNLKVVIKFNEEIIIVDNYFEGTEQINKKKYIDINSYDLKKQESFNRKGKMIEVSNYSEGELLSKKKI